MEKCLITNALGRNATSKTDKYFWRNGNAIVINGKAVDGGTASSYLSNTMLAVATNKYEGRVKASNGQIYDCEEYSFPSKFNSIINAMYVYLHQTAIPLRKHIDVIPTLSKGDIIMTPFEVAKFFELYNAAQTEELKLNVTQFQFSESLVFDVGQVSFDGNWYAVSDDYLSNFIGYAANVTLKDGSLVNYLYPIPPIDASEVERWLTH
jgi:hypothetical protein